VKVIIAGSRDLHGPIDKAVTDSNFTITEVVSGGARGIDRAGEEWAKGSGIPIKTFIPDWEQGKAAGIWRNTDMAEYADALIAIWDGKSKGTLHMINSMIHRKKPVYVYCPN